MDGRVKSPRSAVVGEAAPRQPAIGSAARRAGSELSRGWAACCSRARQVPIEANRRH